MNLLRQYKLYKLGIGVSDDLHRYFVHIETLWDKLTPYNFGQNVNSNIHEYKYYIDKKDDNKIYIEFYHLNEHPMAYVRLSMGFDDFKNDNPYPNGGGNKYGLNEDNAKFLMLFLRKHLKIEFRDVMFGVSEDTIDNF